MKRYGTAPTPLGEMRALAEDDALCGLWFIGQKYAPEQSAAWRYDPELPLFALLRGQLDAYFSGTRQQFNLPLAPEGTPFRQSVWERLLTIPFGSTTTYGALARQLAVEQGGPPPSAQAVGGAVGHNPLAIIVPCHRVIGADGSLTGYAGGLDRKAALLELEKGGSFNPKMLFRFISAASRQPAP